MHDFTLGILKKGPSRRLARKFDLAKVPPGELIKEVMAYMKEYYPSLYGVLVEDRNHVMAANLKKIRTLEPESKILAVVGAGHEEGLKKLLKL